MDVTLNCALGIPDNEEEVVEDEVKKEAKPVMVEQMVNPNVFGGNKRHVGFVAQLVDGEMFILFLTPHQIEVFGVMISSLTEPTHLLCLVFRGKSQDM